MRSRWGRIRPQPRRRTRRSDKLCLHAQLPMPEPHPHAKNQHETRPRRRARRPEAPSISSTCNVFSPGASGRLAGLGGLPAGFWGREMGLRAASAPESAASALLDM